MDKYEYKKWGLPLLGFGAMRLPTLGSNEKVDLDQFIDMVDVYMNSGMNYFDTAYIYHAGQSEGFLGRALEGIREKVNVATKLPSWLVKKPEDIDKIFQRKGVYGNSEELGT